MTREPGSRLVARALAIGLAVAGTALAALGAWVQALISPEPGWWSGYILIFAVIVLSLTLVGAFVAVRVPGNSVGWLLAVAGVGFAISTYSGTYAIYDHRIAGDSLPFATPLAWLGSWLFGPALNAPAVYLLFLFPTGRFLSRRWRAFGIAGIAFIALGSAATALTPGPLSLAPWIANPVALPRTLNGLLVAGQAIGNGLAPIVFFVGAIWSFLVRIRRAGGVERAQLKWFGFVATIGLVGFGLSIPNNGPIADAGWTTGLVALAVLPVAIGVAILRYHLWDIDRIVSRTVSYAVVSGILGGLFAVLIVTFDTVLAQATRGSGLSVAASTVLVAVLFQPLRRRVQDAADRRFNRSRYDAEREIDAFSARMRGEVDVTPLTIALAETLERTLQPTAATVWVRRGDGPAIPPRARNEPRTSEA